MVLDEKGDSFLLATLSKEPTRRFGNKPDEDNDQNTSEALKDERNSPLVVVADIVCSVSNRSGGNTASKPTTVVETLLMSVQFHENRERKLSIDNTDQQHDHASAVEQSRLHMPEPRPP